MTTHSAIGASSMSRWQNCPGSVRLFRDAPAGRSSPYAEEGTRAHEAAEKVLTTGEWPEDADEEMQEAVSVYTDYVNLVVEADPDCTLLIEHRFNLDNLYPGLFGTADCVVWSPGPRRLLVIDYKHGAGIPVEVEHNLQLLYYGLGAMLSLDFRPKDVDLMIVQPRCNHPGGPVRTWSLPAVDMLDFAADLVDAVKATEAPDAPLNPGDWCRFCPAAMTCPALETMQEDLAKTEFSPTVAYDPAELSRTLTTLPIIEARIRAIREFAYGEAEQGRPIPDWKLVAKRATRKWRNEDDAFDLLKTVLPRDLIMSEKIRTVAQIEKEIGKGGLPAGWAEQIVSESSGHTLVPESDKRQAVSLDASNDFTAIGEE